MKLSDIEIAHNAKIEPIGIIAEKLLGHECDLAYEDIGGKMAKLPIGLIDEEKIKVKTVAEEFKKFYALRTYEIYDENNIKIVEGSALFLLIDIVKRRAVKITDDQYKAYNVDKGSTGKNLIGRLERLEKVKNNEYVSNFKVRYSDIDFNKHVNNVKYVQWFMDSVPQEIREEYELKEIDILFEHECYYNDEIKCVCEIHKNEDNLLVLSNIQDKDGKELTVFVSKWE